MTSNRLWGRWLPTPADTEPIEPHTPLEWWPDQRTAEQVLRERRSPQPARADHAAPNSTMRLADGRTLTDVQFWGDERSRIYLYAVTGEPGHDPQPDPQPYGMLEFDADQVVFRNLSGVPSQTVRIEVTDQDTGTELWRRDVVVYPWNIASFGGPADDPNRWTRWLQHVASQGLTTLDHFVSDPWTAAATDLDTGERLAAFLHDPLKVTA